VVERLGKKKCIFFVTMKRLVELLFLDKHSFPPYFLFGRKNSKLEVPMSIIAYTFPERQYKELQAFIKPKLSKSILTDIKLEWPHITLVYSDLSKNDITDEEMKKIEALSKRYKSKFTPVGFDVFEGRDGNTAYFVLTLKGEESIEKLKDEIGKTIKIAGKSRTPHMSLFSFPKKHAQELKELIPTLNKEAKKLFYPATPTAITVWDDHEVSHISEAKASLTAIGGIEEQINNKYKEHLYCFYVNEDSDNRYGPYLQLSNIKLKKESRKQGVGSKIMQELCDYADDRGADIFLTATPEGISKTALLRFYKKFGFVPNAGRNKDFRVMATMVRKSLKKKILSALKKLCRI